MTTANLLNVSPVKVTAVIKADTSKTLQEENLEVAEVFASMMNQTVDFSNPVAEDASSKTDVSKTDSTSVADSYDRYSYKDNQIDVAEKQTVSEKLEAADVDMEEVAEEVVKTLSEEYEVSEDEIQGLLDEMGLSALDLLNPKNLVEFVVALTGAASGEELLLDESFLSVMETLDNMATDLMNNLNVDMNGLQEIISEFEVMNAETQMPATFQETLETQVEATETEATEMTKETEAVEVEVLLEGEESAETETVLDANVTSQAEETTEAVTKEVAEETVEDVTGKVAEETVEGQETVAHVEEADETVKLEVESEEETTDVKVESDETKAVTPSQESEENSFTGNKENNENSLLNQNQGSNETIVTSQTNVTNVGQVTDTSFTQFSSYVSSQTMEIMEQVVEQMKVTISAETTHMEMQLNPENLGKVSVRISEEEGIINAQFTANNEVVKEALETQIATLRENLNQAGVKVDAIEVTIASHEFEQNLEQNQRNTEEENNLQENGTKRRNLTVDSLDDLAGLMTEEEELVAQIMKDNGNSIDFTA